MSWTELVAIAENEVASVLKGLPPEIAKRVCEAAILLEKVPNRQDTAAGIELDTLGLFDLTAEGLMRIRLWLKNIMDYAEGDPSAYRTEVRATLLHEIGHLLGWDEEELEERGLG